MKQEYFKYIIRQEIEDKKIYIFRRKPEGSNEEINYTVLIPKNIDIEFDIEITGVMPEGRFTLTSKVTKIFLENVSIEVVLENLSDAQYASYLKAKKP